MIKYFNDQELFQLLEFDENAENCPTIDLLNEKHPFEIIETPTLKKHLKILKKFEKVTELSNH